MYPYKIWHKRSRTVRFPLINPSRVQLGLCRHVIRTNYWIISIGECILILSLPGKALRTLVDIARLAERFNMRSQSQAW